MKFCGRWSRLLSVLIVWCVYGEGPIELTLTPQAYQALGVLVAVDTASEGVRCAHVAPFVAHMLNHGDQVHAEVREMSIPSTVSQMKDLAQTGFPLAIFLSYQNGEFFWRLYDLLTLQLIKGKKLSAPGFTDQECAVHIATQLWKELMSQDHSFDSLIAACKKMPSKGRARHALYLVHPFLSQSDFAPRMLVDQGNNFAPRWHGRERSIFYSHHMPTNIRLMSVAADRHQNIITDFEGQNMTPTFAPDGKIALALSIHGGVQLFLYQYDEIDKKKIFVPITSEKISCISPSFIDNDTLVFCNIDELNRPRLGIFTLSSKKIRWLPVGRATCPMVSPDRATIAYCKKVNGVAQLFTYTIASGADRQITHDNTHKDECSWSPCGNYVVCGAESGSNSRIALVTVATGHVNFITPANEFWSSPCWSPRLTLPFGF